MSRLPSRKTTKKNSNSCLEEDSMLRFDMVVTWEVKDMCFWLDAVSFTEFAGLHR